MYDLAETHRGWLETSLKNGDNIREEKWTDSMTLGSEALCGDHQGEAWVQGQGAEVIVGDGSYTLKEPPARYRGILGHENAVQRPQNEHLWEGSDEIST
jgi:putative transposase